MLGSLHSPEDELDGIPFMGDPSSTDQGVFFEWNASCNSIIEKLRLQGKQHSETKRRFTDIVLDHEDMLWAVSTLKGLRSDLEHGLLTDFDVVSTAFMAEEVLSTSQELIQGQAPTAINHIVATVLAGVVLEQSIHRLCDKCSPPVPLQKANGDPEKANVLIDKLKQTGLYHEPKSKQLKAWYGLRNSAAHAEFDKVSVEDAKAMVEGVHAFVRQYLA